MNFQASVHVDSQASSPCGIQELVQVVLGHIPGPGVPIDSCEEHMVVFLEALEFNDPVIIATRWVLLNFHYSVGKGYVWKGQNNAKEKPSCVSQTKLERHRSVNSKADEVKCVIDLVEMIVHDFV